MLLIVVIMITNVHADLWLEVPTEFSGDEEQLYYLVLLGLFSLLTHYVDIDPEEGGLVGGACKYILSRTIQVMYHVCVVKSVSHDCWYSWDKSERAPHLRVDWPRNYISAVRSHSIYAN